MGIFLSKTTTPSTKTDCPRHLCTAKPPPDEPHCSICLEDWSISQRIIETSPCKHIFHETCLVTWLNTNNRTTCPYCRQVLYQNAHQSWRKQLNDYGSRLY
ncbi:hypothetical protein K458DRAFT_387332 [Lentithecium fluviatile CBS 122367]|uniref:RING-type domain-containing protein n=1 Tax=Lentithecium fluviatile CBS 122367 TaxID=1168545 RepID=A0A6G1J7W9_9PLEO|nr:hypothetical protein K458DRAFT_387332 [Lentithecium fluviatile CBS 122367]